MNLKNNFNNDKEKIRIRSNKELNARKEEFLILCNILNKLEIKYFLLGGILLGAVRNKGFIPWDWDVEICVYSNDIFYKFDNLYSKILESKFTILKYNKNYSSFKIDIVGKFPKEVTKYTIMGWNHNVKKKIFWRNTLKIPDHFLINMTQIELFGKYHHAPYPTEKYLEHQYGDWKTPKQTSDKDLYLTNKYYGKNLMKKLFKNLLIFLKILK